MKQEPVASSIWESQRIAYEKCGCDTCKKKHTAPRELSNEEIIELTKDSSIFEYREFNDDMVRFAIAILRKAQEK